MLSSPPLYRPIPPSLPFQSPAPPLHPLRPSGSASFSQLSRGQFRRLLDAGNLRTLPPGTVLTQVGSLPLPRPLLSRFSSPPPPTPLPIVHPLPYPPRHPDSCGLSSLSPSPFSTSLSPLPQERVASDKLFFILEGHVALSLNGEFVTQVAALLASSSLPTNTLSPTPPPPLLTPSRLQITTGGFCNTLAMQQGSWKQALPSLLPSQPFRSP